MSPIATAPAPQPARRPAPSPDPSHRGGTVLFEIAFTSAMSDLDLARLARLLDMSTHTHPKTRADANSPGVARLDDFSALFLLRGPGENQWLLQARSWGSPSPQIVHGWHLLGAQAAHRLDPKVGPPQPLPQPRDTRADRTLGQAAGKRLARLRRRLVGLG